MIFFAYLILAGVSAAVVVTLNAAGVKQPVTSGSPRDRRVRSALDMPETNQMVPDNLAGGNQYSLPDYNFRNLLQRKAPAPAPQREQVSDDPRGDMLYKEYEANRGQLKPPSQEYRVYGNRVPDQISRRAPVAPKFLGVDTTARDVIQSVIRGGQFVIDKIKARGIRNNNPGNIRIGSKWQGLSQEQTDKSFAQFDSPVYGIRALAVLLRNYDKKYGINTIRGIIERYAPSTENNTAAYVAAVSKQTGYGADVALNLANNELLRKVIEAIIKHENGEQPYTLTTIDEGIALA